MTRYERVMAALSLGEPDVTPVVHTWNAFTYRHAGYTFSECNTDGRKHVEAQLKCLEDFGVDAVWAPTATGPLCEACGADVRYLDDNPPVNGPGVVKTDEDIASLGFTSVRDAGRIPWVLETTRNLRKGVGREIPIFAVVPSPHTIADALRGTQELFKDFVRRPALVEALIDKCVAPAVEFADLVAEAGANVAWVPEPLCSGTCISRMHYVRFVYPYTRRLFLALRGQGIKSVHHVCGDWHDRLDLSHDGPTALHLAAEADLAEVKATYGSKVALMGNIRSVDLLFGTPEAVAGETRDCLARGASGGGFILSCDCSLPPGSPKENVLAVTTVARSRPGGR
ncbi:MAG: uroporphyrinogen decarboxylase family protein [Chloroflexi bacterium]|nr:uroporphyrinogen decarboxylase family protein [Chloroflexota bacterium]